MSDQGAIHFEVTFLSDWPPEEPSIIFERVLSDGKEVMLGGLPDGSFKAFLGPRNAQDLILHSTPVRFTGRGDCKLTLLWSGASGRLRIAGAELPSFAERPDGIEIPLRSVEVTEESTSSIDHPDAREACKEWILWRSDHLRALKVPKDRIRKNEAQHVADLGAAVSRIKRLVRTIRGGDGDWMGSLAVELRGLLCWSPKHFEPDFTGRQNTPLLPRVASFLDLPLPVWSSNTSDPESLIRGLPRLSDLELAADPNLSLTRDSTEQRLIDIQEWLNEGGVFRGTKFVRFRSVIASLANTAGPAHYDSGVPPLDVLLQGIKFDRVHVLGNLILEVSEVTSELSEYVLKELDESSSEL